MIDDQNSSQNTQISQRIYVNNNEQICVIKLWFPKFNICGKWVPKIGWSSIYKFIVCEKLIWYGESIYQF